MSHVHQMFGSLADLQQAKRLTAAHNDILSKLSTVFLPAESIGEDYLLARGSETHPEPVVMFAFPNMDVQSSDFGVQYATALQHFKNLEAILGKGAIGIHMHDPSNQDIDNIYQIGIFVPKIAVHRTTEGLWSDAFNVTAQVQFLQYLQEQGWICVIKDHDMILNAANAYVLEQFKTALLDTSHPQSDPGLLPLRGLRNAGPSGV